MSERTPTELLRGRGAHADPIAGVADISAELAGAARGTSSYHRAACISHQLSDGVRTAPLSRTEARIPGSQCGKLSGFAIGGDGINTFGLPDMQSRVPVGSGQGGGLTNRNLGGRGGQESVALTIPHLPAHRNPIHASSVVGNSKAAAGNVPATS
jgi:hypothetical protein